MFLCISYTCMALRPYAFWSAHLNHFYLGRFCHKCHICAFFLQCESFHVSSVSTLLEMLYHILHIEMTFCQGELFFGDFLVRYNFLMLCHISHIWTGDHMSGWSYDYSDSIYHEKLCHIFRIWIFSPFYDIWCGVAKSSCFSRSFGTSGTQMISLPCSWKKC